MLPGRKPVRSKDLSIRGQRRFRTGCRKAPSLRVGRCSSCTASKIEALQHLGAPSVSLLCTVFAGCLFETVAASSSLVPEPQQSKSGFRRLTEEESGESVLQRKLGCHRPRLRCSSSGLELQRCLELSLCKVLAATIFHLMYACQGARLS